QVGPPLRRLSANEVRIEVSVRLLRLRYAGDDVVDLRIERRIGMRGERVARHFDPFGDIGIPVHHGRGRPTVEWNAQRTWRAVHVERFEQPVLLVLGVQEWYGALSHRWLARRP